MSAKDHEMPGAKTVDAAITAHHAVCKSGHGVTSGEVEFLQAPACIWAHYVQMRAAGWDVTYETVAVVSGSTALFAYDPKSLMPKYSHLLIRPDDQIAEATGFGYEWKSFDTPEQAWQIIRESVDSGRPVKGFAYENVLFVGYQDAPGPANRKVLVLAEGPDEGGWLDWGKFVAWTELVKGWHQSQLGRFKERVGAKPSAEVVSRVIGQLVTASNVLPETCNKFGWNTHSKVGLGGIEAYALDTGDMAKSTKEYFKEGSWCGCHAINPQWTARAATAAWLRGAAASGAVNDADAEHMLSAAGHYEKAYEAWKVFHQQEWVDEPHRKRAAEAVWEWLEHERKAIDELSMVKVK